MGKSRSGRSSRRGPTPRRRPPEVAGSAPAAPRRAPAPASAAPTATATVTAQRGAPAPADAGGEPAGPLLHAVPATHWLDVPADAQTLPATVLVDGRGVDGPAEGRSFTREIPVPAVPPGTGPLAVSLVVSGLPEGSWRLRTRTEGRQPVAPGTPARPARLPRRAGRPQTGPVQEQVVPGRLFPFVHAPGVWPFAWPLLVLLGVVQALWLQAVLVDRDGGDGLAAAAAGLTATVVGYLGAKAYYMVQHRVRLRGFVSAGTCIQGFLLASFGTLLAVAALTGLDVLRVVDRTAPGVLFAMALGRPGCWFGGCCAGRLSVSRWALWSSDRRIGARRLPVQLVESALALAAGLVALVVVLLGHAHPPGVTAVLAFALYTLGRQVLFPWRAEQRMTRSGRRLVSGTTLGASLLAGLVLLAT